MRKSMKCQLISSLGLVAALTACGEGGSSSVPPGIPPAPAPKNLIEPANALSVGAGGPTIITGPSAPVVTAGSLDLKALNGSAWASTCYRFSDKGDYSKKFWSFAEGKMNSLLLKYKDDACTQVTAPSSPYGVWDISSITVSSHTDDWSIVQATCTSGNCSAVIDMAMRVKGSELHEGTKDKNTGSYYIADGRYIAFTKADVKLDKLVTDANGGRAPTTGTPRPTTPTTPTTPTQPTAPVSTEGATGLDLLASLAGKTYSICIPGRAAANGTPSSSLRTLSFAKGADLATDSYSTGNSTFPSTDCTGVARVSAPWSFNNLVVKTADVAGWISIEARGCTGSGCKPQKALMQLTTTPEGFKHAGETSTPGTYFIETPRDYVLVP